MLDGLDDDAKTVACEHVRNSSRFWAHAIEVGVDVFRIFVVSMQNT
jgi:hypothetical protein